MSPLTTITLKGALGYPLCDGSMPSKAQKDVCESALSAAAANFFPCLLTCGYEQQEIQMIFLLLVQWRCPLVRQEC